MPKFVPRERKHKRIAKQRVSGRDSTDRPNAEIILPTSKDEKEERRRRFQEELKAQQPESRVTSKKRKRLDKYIDTKLKKEENLELLRKLAAQKVDTSLLQSAKKLGRVNETKRERIEHALKEQDAGIDASGTRDAILYEQRDVQDGTLYSPPSFGELHENDSSSNAEPAIAEHLSAGAVSVHAVGAFGSGLKRPLETDEFGKPVIKKRKRRRVAQKAAFTKQDEELYDALEEDDQSGSEASHRESAEWNRFDSEHESRSDVSSADEDSDQASEPDSDIDSDQSEPSDAVGQNASRVSAFKAWADSQRNEAIGFTPSAVHVQDEALRSTFKPRAPSPDAAVAEIMSTTRQFESLYRPAVSVTIPRSGEVQKARLNLPVVQDEQKIMEAIHNNSTTVICGATGSGKTTQLPQMLMESGYASTGMIGVTQPRRVAATAVASRVAFELGDIFGKQVAHQVRYDSNVGCDTKIKFMTDGILLREISQDFALSKYSAIIIDEAHERSVNTDILIGMLSRIIPLRQELSREEPAKYHPLKLIIMSATLRVTDFILNDRLFKSTKPPIVEAEGRQYKVTEHFARRTQRDYVAETVHKVSRGHRKLPPGGILVFLTGQDEIQTVAKRLRENLATDRTGFKLSASKSQRPMNDYLEYDEQAASDSDAEITGLDDDDDSDAEFEVEADERQPQQRGGMNAHILPLFAALPASKQMKIFQPAPEGSRSIILSTNVAETSLTIPGIKYVFDCGRSKEKQYDITTGVQEFQIDWISKAGASQRMGRAGRTGPGHCYRLYSSAVYEQYFDEHTVPEILRTPIEGTVLQLKNLNVDNIVNFPFPTPPQGQQLTQAERLLKNLGAIDAKKGTVTDIGKELIHYPVNPRFGKMLLLGLRNGVHAHTVALVAGLAVGDLFVSEARPTINANPAAASDSEDSERDAKKRLAARSELDDSNKQRQAYGRAQATLSAWDDKSDAIKLLTAVAAHAAQEDKHEFCSQYFLREKGMDEVEQLRRQLHNILQSQIQDGTDVSFKTVPLEPKPRDISVLKQIVAAGYIDNVAIRADLIPSAAAPGRKPTRAIEVPYRTLISSISESDIDRAGSLQDQERQRSVYVHASSVLARLSPNEMPPYIVYSTLSRTAAGAIGERPRRTRIHPLTTVGPKQLAALAEGTPLLDIGKPIGKIEESEGGKRRQCWVGISLRDPNAVGTSGWPLPAWKVIQARKETQWVIEKVLDRGK